MMQMLTVISDTEKFKTPSAGITQENTADYVQIACVATAHASH